MIKYTIKEIYYAGQLDDFVFEFTKEYEALSYFLSADVTPFEDWIKEDFDKVLSGEEDCVESSGNGSAWEIHRDKTRIDFLFPPDENEEVWCEVDTTELRALIDEWCEKKREFDKKHNKK